MHLSPLGLLWTGSYKGLFITTFLRDSGDEVRQRCHTLSCHVLYCLVLRFGNPVVYTAEHGCFTLSSFKTVQLFQTHQH